MSELRTPFFVVAVVFMALVVLLELGSSLVVGGDSAGSQLEQEARELEGVGDVVAGDVDEPPGRALFYLVLVDGILLYTVLLMGASLVVPERVHGRAQGCLTFVGSIVLIIVALILAILAFIELMVMVTLFLSIPFGTIAYLALWGFFPRGDAAALLGLIMFLKLLFCVFLVLAQQRFLQMKGLLALIITSLVCTLLIGFLHGLVPVIIVSIFDNVGAIVVAIIAIIWGIVLLILSIPSLVASLRSGAA
jgi:hypothetical protein